MSSVIEEIVLKSSLLPEEKQQEILDFVSFVYEKVFKTEINETMLLSEKSLFVDWSTKEEEEAWQKFQ